MDGLSHVIAGAIENLRMRATQLENEIARLCDTDNPNPMKLAAARDELDLIEEELRIRRKLYEREAG